MFYSKIKCRILFSNLLQIKYSFTLLWVVWRHSVVTNTPSKIQKLCLGDHFDINLGLFVLSLKGLVRMCLFWHPICLFEEECSRTCEGPLHNIQYIQCIQDIIKNLGHWLFKGLLKIGRKKTLVKGKWAYYFILTNNWNDRTWVVKLEFIQFFS